MFNKMEQQEINNKNYYRKDEPLINNKKENTKRNDNEIFWIGMHGFWENQKLNLVYSFGSFLAFHWLLPSIQAHIAIVSFCILPPNYPLVCVFTTVFHYLNLG